DPVLCELMKTYLEQRGLVVHIAHDGQTGIQRAKELAPDAITLDALMPQADGWQVLTALKGDPATASIPVVMVTVMDDRRKGFALGVSDYFTKPVDWNRLFRVIEEYVGQNGPPRILIVDDE